MGKWYLFIIVLSLFSCKTTKIKDQLLETSNATVELGAIGHSKSFIFDKDFSSRTYPKLQDKIRLDLQVIPFNKKQYNKYSAKAKFNQLQKKIVYNDSIDLKPEFVLIRLMDTQSYISELNADYNTATSNFIKGSGKASLVSAIALVFDGSDLEKVRSADAYYLINKQHHKYDLALFSQGKQTAILNIKNSDTFAYEISSFCWIFNNKGKWELADIQPYSKECKGSTTPVVTQKKASRNLFKM